MDRNTDSTERARLLATDLDGTFIGDDPEMHRLWADLDAAGIVVAFSTGRHIPSIERFYAESRTERRAAACVCMVGTEIWHLERDGYVRDHSWTEVISDGWDKAKVAAIVGAVPEATLQDAEWQSGFKCSYILESNVEHRLDQIRHDLERAGLAAKVVFSVGRYLDLLPYRSGKGAAVAHLAGTLGVTAEDVITAGDSGNDIDMMRPEVGFRAIAVGNAASELAAFEAPSVYHADAPFAAGIREGLEHYGWL